MKTILYSMLASLLMVAAAGGSFAYIQHRADIEATPDAYAITDKDTGCQYLAIPGRGTTPRLDKNGYPMGCANR